MRHDVSPFTFYFLALPCFACAEIHGKKTPSSASRVHKHYEHFSNSYKTFIAGIFCLHIIDSSEIKAMKRIKWHEEDFA